MRFIHSAAAFAVTLCLALGMLFSAAVPARAEESYSILKLLVYLNAL